MVIKKGKTYDYKIYVCGYFQAGKTTLIHSLDPNAMSIEKKLRELYYGKESSTTVGFDLGHLVWARPRENTDGILMSWFEFEKERDEYKDWICKLIELKGSPGQLHFKDMRNIVSKGSDGILFVIDSSDPGSIGYALTLIEESRCFLGKSIPLVVLANKQDLEIALPPEKVSDLIKFETFGGSAKNNFGVKEALIRLLRIIVKEIKQDYQNYLIKEEIQ